MSKANTWDLAIIGAGPAGSAAAIGALHARSDLSVLLVDRAQFPRDKACGDGIAPHVLELLTAVGVTGLLDDHVPVSRLRLERGGVRVARTMSRPGWVSPRTVFDARLVTAACDAGAELIQHRVRDVTIGAEHVTLDDSITARVVIGADGANSKIRATTGLPQGPTALALRGYAPTPPARRGEQVIAFGTTPQPSYAWSFDRGDGLANVGYGELLSGRRSTLSRQFLLARLEALLPGATVGGTGWRGHHLPLSTCRWPHPPGRVLLAGDAAALVNPLTGEGIYYAVATGLLAGRAAAAIKDSEGADPGRIYRQEVRSSLAGHLRHTAVAARLVRAGPVLDAGMLAAAGDQRVFDDLVEMGLGRGRITPLVAHSLVRAARHRVVGDRLGSG